MENNKKGSESSGKGRGEDKKKRKKSGKMAGRKRVKSGEMGTAEINRKGRAKSAQNGGKCLEKGGELVLEADRKEIWITFFICPTVLLLKS
jgi:hypothetical protein